MKNKITIAIASLLAVAVLLIAACAPKEAQPQLPPAPEQPAAAVAAEVPEIAQAEQTVQEIGTPEVDEIDKDLDTLVLP
ncbi:hypothetical protein HYU16_03185 [Candidatus Woesearchaeota archaeon]|nr:hypothetical protein [Candidatus Woesearchaeota archaeon]